MFSDKGPACRQAGQTLLELVTTVAVSIIIIGALVFATISSLRNAQFSKNQSLATKLAQEGIERVRVGRDRNSQVTVTGNITLTSWNGTSSTLCTGSTVIKSDSLWCYRISGDCDKPDLIPNPGLCYFNVDSTGKLTPQGFAQTSFPSGAEIPPNTNSLFRRVVTLSDDLNHDKIFNSSDDYQNQKEATVVVTWTDFSGSHESRLSTVLRRIQ